MAFPGLIPSSRRFTPSQWPVTRHKFMTGAKQSMLFATSAYKAELRLVYANRTPSQVALFMAHYDKQGGTHSSFKLPGNWAERVWGGWRDVRQDEKTLAINGRWRYAAPPRISQQKGKTATIEIALVQVPGTNNVKIRRPDDINCGGGAPSGPGGGDGGGSDGGGDGDGGGTGPLDPLNPDDWDGTEVLIPEDVRDECYKFRIDYIYHIRNADQYLCGSNTLRFYGQSADNEGIIYSSQGYSYKLEYVRTRKCVATWNCNPYTGNFNQDYTIEYGGIVCPDGPFEGGRSAAYNGDFDGIADNCSGNFCLAYKDGPTIAWSSITRILIYKSDGTNIWDWTPDNNTRSISPTATSPSSCCPSAGPPIDPGTPIDPVPNAPEGPEGNGPPGFPGGQPPSGGGPGGSEGDTPSGPGQPPPAPPPGPECDPFFGPCGDDPIPLPTNPPGAPEGGMLYQVQGYYSNMRTYTDAVQCPECDNENVNPAGTRYEDCTKTYPSIGLNSNQLFGYSVVDQEVGVNPGDITVQQTFSTLHVQCYGADDVGTTGKIISQAFYKGQEIRTSYGNDGKTRNQYKCGKDQYVHYYHKLNQLIYRYSVPGVGTVSLEVYRNPDYIDDPGYDGCDDRAVIGGGGSTRLLEPTPRNNPSTDPGPFPRHTPSRRSMKYGEWNTKKSNPGKSNQSVTLPLPKKSIKSEVILELVYANRADGVARDFMNHYLASAGVWDDFKLPNEQLKEGPMAGWSVKGADRYLSKGRWAYNRPPQVTSVHPGTSTVTVQLISLESKAFAGPGAEIKPLEPCECPPPYSPGPPPSDSNGPDGSPPQNSPGPGTPTPDPWPDAPVPPNPPVPLDQIPGTPTPPKPTSEEFGCGAGNYIYPVYNAEWATSTTGNSSPSTTLGYPSFYLDDNCYDCQGDYVPACDEPNGENRKTIVITNRLKPLQTCSLDSNRRLFYRNDDVDCSRFIDDWNETGISVPWLAKLDFVKWVCCTIQIEGVPDFTDPRPYNE